MKSKQIPLAAIAVLAATAGCTQQKQDSFRLLQALEEHDAATEFNTRVDLLWVIDNSASMDVSQDRLRKGLKTFAERYMKSNWDIRFAVITTDTYLAHPAYQAYLNATLHGTVGWRSSYLGESFPEGLSWSSVVPSWGTDYARLLPGTHDGPIAARCMELHSYFFEGAAQCRIRDAANAPRGNDSCLHPADGQSAVTQCVNTLANDTVHSGTTIVSTLKPEGVDAAAWEKQMHDTFMLNASVGSSGIGSERGLASVLQLLSDNEGTETSFFRANSHRVIIFVADEDDQSMTVPTEGDASPFDGYHADCEPKQVEDHFYTLTRCPDSGRLIPVESVKAQLDEFFTTLDGPSSKPNYFVAAITPLTGKSIQMLQTERSADDLAVGAPENVAVDRGDRYLELARQVGRGSLELDIASEDYSALLDNIGRAIIDQKSVFPLEREPTSEEDMIVTLLRADGSTEIIPAGKFVIEGESIRFTDPDLVLGFGKGDRIRISYQPKTVY